MKMNYNLHYIHNFYTITTILYNDIHVEDTQHKINEKIMFFVLCLAMRVLIHTTIYCYFNIPQFSHILNIRSTDKNFSTCVIKLWLRL